MNNFDPIDIEFLINNAQVAKDAAATKKSISGVVNSAEESVKTANKRIANTFVQTEKHLQTQQKTLVSNKRKWDGLGNSINQLSREAPAFAVSAQTGFLALSNNIPMLADEISKLRKENELLTASGQKGTPVWKQLLKSLFSWQTMLSLGVTLLTIYGKEVGKWIGSLLNGKKAIDEVKASKKALNDAFKSTDYKKAVSGLLTVKNYLDSAKKGYIDKTIAVKKYNEVLGETFGKVNDITTAEKNLNSKAGAYIEAMLYKTAATLTLETAASELIENAQKQFASEQKIDKAEIQKKAELKARAERQQTGTTIDVNDRSSESLANAPEETQGYINNQQSKIDELKKEADKHSENALKIADKFNKKVSEIAKKFKLDLYGDGNSNTTKTANTYENLLKKIAELDKEYARKSLTQNEEEVQALKDKFSKIRELVEAFNSDKKNQGKQIDVNQLNPIENKALGDLTFRQKTKTLKKELENKKVVYQEFEEYKKQFGIQKAKEKYAEEIGEFDSYLDYLKNKIAQNQDSITAVGRGTATGGQKERSELLLTSKDDAVKTQNKEFTDLLASLQNYQAKRKQLVENYNAERKELVSKGFVSEAEELAKQHQENLSNLDEAYAKSTPEYKALLLGVENYSKQAAKEVIANARKMVAALVAAGKLSSQAAADINKKINELEDSLNKSSQEGVQKILDDVRTLGGSFYELSDSVAYFDEDLAGTLETMGDIANVGADVLTVFTSKDPVQMVTSAISAISGLLNMSQKVKESERLARQEIAEWQWDMFTAQIAYNTELRERVMLEASLNDLYQSRVASIKEEMAANSSNASQVIEDQNAVFQKLLQTETVVRKYTKKTGGFLGAWKKTKVVEEKQSIADLLGIDASTLELTDDLFDKLEQINGKNPLTDDAKDAYDELVKLRDEYGSIEEAQRALEIQLKDAITGTTAQSIGDALTNAISDGSASFYELGQDAEQFLRQGIIAGLSTQFIEPEMQNLQDKLAEFLDDGVLTTDEAEDWKEMYQQVGEAINEYQDIMNEAGIDLVDNANSGLSGAIAAQLTEQTGSELTGLFRAYYEISKQQLDVSTQANGYHQKSYELMQQHLLVMANIEQNTHNTVLELKNSITQLKAINTNTKETYSRL